MTNAPANPEDTLNLAVLHSLCRSGEARHLRERYRLSLRDVATAIGCDAVALSRWERLGTPAGRAIRGGPLAVAYAEFLAQLAGLAGLEPQ